MDVAVTYLDSPGDVPARMPSPFAPEPVPIARRAMERLRAELPVETLRLLATDGKMFGVLVVRDGDRIGFLRAFSGMIGRSWHLPGFVPPAFDEAARDSFWIAGEAELATLTDPSERAALSRTLLPRIHATYVLPNARGEVRALRDLFRAEVTGLQDKEPPGGAGDCAAPKLLAYAYRHGLAPIALAEQWIGAPPTNDGRIDGNYYPACRGKCGPILAHMLAGIDVEEAPQYGGGPISADEPRTLFEDDWLVIVDKPVGLLSIPGRGGALRDSVIMRLRARYGSDVMVVHRLDLDTSGVLLAAKDAATYKALQRLFAIREVEKRYVAILDGQPSGDRGTIDLPLRVDVDDRPRQIVDAVHGKPAITDWEVLAKAGGRTRVALSPRTGRAHQLRVHMAVGLGAPIVGDRLYGRSDGGRLMLHAEALGFVHPHTGSRVAATREAPF
ncbi:MAG TPA: RluA family pseudouridine synthase [Kofleriaceae bacterium]|nr:RluA family pseudouridine synthase [Kofleriaceae bacterium]